MENNRLGTEKVSKLLLSLAAPAICAQIVTLLYNLVDRIYIGWMADGMLAMAAVISQFASFVWVMAFLFGKRTQLKIRPGNLRPRFSVLRQIVVLGSAPFFMSLSEGLLHICFNNQARRFGGDVAVSAMTILFSLFQFILLPVEGVSQGSQPIISYNYGAKLYHRVRQTVRIAVVCNLTFTAVATAFILIFPGAFIRIFNSDPELLAAGVPMLRVYAAGLFVHGANSTFQQTYNSLGEGEKAFFFAFFRKIILLIPLLYLLPEILPWGVLAVMLAEPISDLLTTVTNALYFRRFLRQKLPAETELENPNGGILYDRT